ncbi:DEAD/DEAH box helicase [Photorhabdus sp. CRCIA-P01]|uniref:DEAD/DEAH box helicase n=1 Tax=Photorhabdus sp. CRCIA-P01 TaxID=2019570 RepID=UPI000E59CBD6|nr:DEAD/DEAH box helicase [Photorhabdus sp. CRCIA-P01]
MTLSFEQLKAVDQHWAVQAIDAKIREMAFNSARYGLVKNALGNLFTETHFHPDYDAIEQAASAYELAAIESLRALLHPSSESSEKDTAVAGAHRAFGLMRILPIPEKIDQRVFHVLHIAGLAYAGDRWTDLRRWFEENEQNLQIPSVTDVAWNKRVVYRLFDAWVRLLRKRSWDDLDQIAEIIVGLRHDQSSHEKNFLDQTQGITRQSEAIRLVSLYHWAKATERLATYMLQGEPLAIEPELDQHFEAALKAAQISCDTKLEMLLRWLHVSSRKMVEGSIWWVAHSVNSRVTRFVEHVTRYKSMFELLPPQRTALQEQNLLDPASRAVVIDMPTSGGKTQLAQFRMLQALNQFAEDGGWIAYVAPTRALVSQITRRLRSDFSPLCIKVEQLSGAVEVDSFEDALLGGHDSYQVLVATPEKLQLVIRNKKVQRPLALLVLDEAHNIEDNERGLRIELLLATIKQEASRANFLLLMPFVPNANELAQWLGSGRGKSISLSTSAWQPNERIVGLFDVERVENGRQGDWKLTFETLTTTQRTLHLHGIHDVDGVRPIRTLNYSTAKSLSKQAAAMAKVFSKRGTSIAVAQKIPDVWTIARLVANEMDPLDRIPDEIALVQRFLSTEVSPDFELIGMLEKGVVVHHAGLPAEALALIEWLTEEGHIKVMCATMTIAQGLNFPVSSVFLASPKYPYGIKMSPREFWNLAGRAGRIGHDSVGVVGIAAGNDPNEIRQFVSDATGELLSRLVSMLEELDSVGELQGLSAVIHQEQWADFRSYIAHMWNEKRNLDEVIAEAEQFLRNTYGFSVLRAKPDPQSQQQADALLEATRGYVRQIAAHPENAALADSTGFSPEGVRTALLELTKLENRLTIEDWHPNSLFGNEGGRSALPDLMGVMMRVPQLQKSLSELGGNGLGYQRLADITQAWVDGASLEEIANRFFDERDFTSNLSNACRAVYRDLANNGAWGLSALSKMPTAGIDFDNLTGDDLRTLNNLPAMLYHGVRTEEGVLMRMNSVPRSIAENLGADFKRYRGEVEASLAPSIARDYLSSLSPEAWSRLRPADSAMSGDDYRKIWKQLSGV